MNRHLLSLVVVILVLLTQAPLASDLDVKSLELIGSIQSANGRPYGIDIKGNVAYLADFTEGNQNFQTYDISDPTTLVRIGTVETDQEMDEVVVEENRAYIANDYLGLSIFDVANPSLPLLLGQRSDGQYADTVALLNLPTKCPKCAIVGYLYSGHVKIYDVSNPGSIPDPISYDSSDSWGGGVWDVAVNGNRAYLWVTADPDIRYLEMLDLGTLPSPPGRLGKLDMPIEKFGNVGNLAVRGRYLYAASSRYYETETSGGLRIIDVLDPGHPKMVGRLDMPDIGHVPWQGADVTVENVGGKELAFMVGRTSLHIIDVSKPANPSEIAS